MEQSGSFPVSLAGGRRFKSYPCNQVIKEVVSKSKKVGRPLKFKSVKELEDKIEAYFANENNIPWTITDLAYWLDCDRQTLLNYQEKEEFFGTIKKAKTKIEASIEKRALLGIYNSTFAIFNMKNNFGWQDKHEVDTTNSNRIEIINDLPSDVDEDK